MKQTILFGLAFLLFGCASPDKKTLDNPFYAFNNCVRTLPNAPQTMQEQAKLIKEIGFDGFAGHTSEDYYQRRAVLDEVGLMMPEIYWGMTLEGTGEITYKEEIKDIIRDSEGRDLMVALFLNAPAHMDNKEEGDPLVAEGIRELADYAARYGAKVAVYPHANNYCETIHHAVKLAELAGRENAGLVFNACHLLKVEGEEGWKEKALAALPHLYMVSINGADSGNTKEMGWDRLIQPLGEGTFDTYEVVRFIKDNGYEGLFGLQCYNIDQDCETALRKSMDTWKSYQERYSQE